MNNFVLVESFCGGGRVNGKEKFIRKFFWAMKDVGRFNVGKFHPQFLWYRILWKNFMSFSSFSLSKYTMEHIKFQINNNLTFPLIKWLSRRGSRVSEDYKNVFIHQQLKKYPPERKEEDRETKKNIHILIDTHINLASYFTGQLKLKLIFTIVSDG